jgi:hypothetical protein
MSASEQDTTAPSRSGCLVALGLVFLPALAASLVGLPGGELPSTLFFGLLLAAPFAYLALDGAKDRRPWLVASALTALFWGALIVSVFMSTRDETGVNIGMGLVMLASPFVITLGAWLANRRA